MRTNAADLQSVMALALLDTTVSVVQPDDDTDVLGIGVVVYVSGTWLGVRLSGETRVDEYPIERVFAM